MPALRTTVRLPGDLMRRAKLHAARQGRTLTGLLADALRAALDGPDRRPTGRKVVLPTYGGGGVRPGVNIHDTSEVFDLMDGPGDPRRR